MIIDAIFAALSEAHPLTAEQVFCRLLDHEILDDTNDPTEWAKQIVRFDEAITVLLMKGRIGITRCRVPLLFIRERTELPAEALAFALTRIEAAITSPAKSA